MSKPTVGVFTLKELSENMPKTIEAPTIDKSSWGPGPWQSEPDRVEFEHAGFPCLMLRQPRLGHWCGYVAVPPGHPWHGKGYDDVDARAHGGLTYAEKCSGGVCHVPKPGEPDDVWWLGFDCAHLGDFSPVGNSQPYAFGSPEEYRDAEWVRREVERLAAQAGAARASLAEETGETKP